MRYFHFLFGSEAVNMFYSMHDGTGENPSYDAIAEAIRPLDHAVYVYDDSMNVPTDILSEYDGWQGWAMIPDTLYKLLLKA